MLKQRQLKSETISFLGRLAGWGVADATRRFPRRAWDGFGTVLFLGPSAVRRASSAEELRGGLRFEAMSFCEAVALAGRGWRE